MTLSSALGTFSWQVVVRTLSSLSLTFNQRCFRPLTLSKKTPEAQKIEKLTFSPFFVAFFQGLETFTGQVAGRSWFRMSYTFNTKQFRPLIFLKKETEAQKVEKLTFSTDCDLFSLFILLQLFVIVLLLTTVFL